jgi:hypothetical protein
MVMMERKFDEPDPDHPFEKWYGLDDAILGYIDDQWGTGKYRLVYSIDKMATIFMERDGMDFDDAYEYIDFNIINAYVGPQTPVYVRTLLGEWKDDA